MSVQVKTIFGKEYHLQESSENTDLINKIADNWKRIGHSVARFKDKKNKQLIHLYASRFKTRSF